MRIARRGEMDLHNSLQICSLTQLLATADKCSLFWITGTDLLKISQGYTNFQLRWVTFSNHFL